MRTRTNANKLVQKPDISLHLSAVERVRDLVMRKKMFINSGICCESLGGFDQGQRHNCGRHVVNDSRGGEVEDGGSLG